MIEHRAAARCFCMKSPRFVICFIMKNKRFRHRLLRAAELPQDLDPSLFFIQWTGNGELLIEQHRGILRFDSAEIRFKTDQGVVRVLGSALMLDRMSESRALIFGTISDVSLEAKS